MDTLTQYFRACEDGDTEVVRGFLSNAADIASHGKQTGFLKAVMNGQVEVVRLLLAHPSIKVNSNPLDSSWCDDADNGDANIATSVPTPLMYAVIHDHVEITKLLLAHPNINVNKRVSNSYSTAIHYAILRGYLEHMELILRDPTFNVNVVNADGYSLLELASLSEDSAVYEMLIEYIHGVCDTSADESADVSAVETKMSVPPNTEDAIYGAPIENGTLMVDFHGEREFGRYYTKSSYHAIQQPKRNPMTRQPILRSEVIFYIADVSADVSAV